MQYQTLPMFFTFLPPEGAKGIARFVTETPYMSVKNRHKDSEASAMLFPK